MVRKNASRRQEGAKKASKSSKSDPRQMLLLPAEPSAEKVKPKRAEPSPEPKAGVGPQRGRSIRRRVSAEELSAAQREISISEFFTKNRHLLGFDNASRALLSSVKEAVDNSLDACEEAGILPEIRVLLEPVGEGRYRMTVEDNGPGIVKSQIPKVFGKLLYGSKFHRLRQSRGQQGIGISAAGMYGQLTTGQPVAVTSKTGKGRPAHHYLLVIDTSTNRPVIIQESKLEEWNGRDHGTCVGIEMEAVYKGGRRSVDEWVQQVAFANPHVRIEYWAPGRRPVVYPRLSPRLPPETKQIKPHPYGVELGLLQRMLMGAKTRSVSGFLQSEFSRVSAQVAAQITKEANVPGGMQAGKVSQMQVEAIYKAIGKTKIMAPPTNCLAPIGEEAMLKGLRALLVQQHLAVEETAAARRKGGKEAPKPDDPRAAEAAEQEVHEALQAVVAQAEEPDDAVLDETDQETSEEASASVTQGGVITLFGRQAFLTAVTRGPKVYRGNPFQVEAALAYGGELSGDDLATLYRFANRVPLLYQQGACAMTQAVLRTNWKTYDVDQSRGALPSGPLLVLVHIASVWVPFTSEAKEAVAHYDEIIAELKSALQECGRRLSRHIRRRRRVADAEKKQRYIVRYIPQIGLALQQILALSDAKRDKAVDKLALVLERSRKM